ncbi:N-acetyltransferase [Massilia sp. TS11]|uniref:GNAT family N-acetyltransferase n=1 Tax=Massilia sp. TS11 TaxID=2908003 RepID=UPI001EDA62CD|nr:GNAT family N-acetyltransferase [Massilia sp. TS11]MCG2583954.1 GNAT family N-acetyltransferase [Massilia sp. TS11]
MEAVIRQAQGADLDELMRLERAGFAPAIQETAETFAGRLAAFPGGCWVIDGGDGRLYGYLCAEFWPYAPDIDAARFARDHAAADTHRADGTEVYVSSTVIDPALRGGGWGRRLFEGALARMQASAPWLCSAILIVHPEWLGARRIYSSAGFGEIGQIDGYFPGHPAIIMRRSLLSSARRA